LQLGIKVLHEIPLPRLRALPAPAHGDAQAYSHSTDDSYLQGLKDAQIT